MHKGVVHSATNLVDVIEIVCNQLFLAEGGFSRLSDSKLKTYDCRTMQGAVVDSLFESPWGNKSDALCERRNERPWLSSGGFSVAGQNNALVRQEIKWPIYRPGT